MKKKALIIEDNMTDAAIAKDAIAMEGIDCEIATTGNEGIEKALKLKPDIIILDLLLPDISGFDVCKDLKARPELTDTIIVILSIKDDMRDIERAFDMNADDYIIKPPNPAFLAKKIKLYLGKKDDAR